MLAVGAHKREDGTWIGPQSVREQFEAAQVQELSLDNAPQQDPGFDTPLFVVDVQPGDVVPDFPPRARCWHGFDGLSCDVVYVASACSIGPNGRDLGLGVFFGPENERQVLLVVDGHPSDVRCKEPEPAMFGQEERRICRAGGTSLCWTCTSCRFPRSAVVHPLEFHTNTDSRRSFACSKHCPHGACRDC